MPTPSPYNIVGPRGEKLYPSPKDFPGKFRNLGRLKRHIKQAVSPLEWAEMVEISAKLAAATPALRGAIRQKAEWAFAGDSWQPIYYGPHEKWGDIATEWLTTQVFPNALLGNIRKDIIKAMQVSGMAWDIHGDDLALYVLGAGNLPKMRVIPGTRIGNGPEAKGIGAGWSQTVSGNSYNIGTYTLHGMGTCVGGRYDGFRIYNGIIYDDVDEPIAARVLGWKREGGTWVETFTDFDIGFAHGTHLASEYEWHDMGRPLPRIATSIMNWMHKEQIDQDTLRGVANAVRRTVIHKLPPGMDAMEARGDAAEMITVDDGNGNTQRILVDTTEAGDVTYISSGENLEGLKYENPHPNVEDFVRRITSECLSDLGWPYELTDLSTTGRAPTRVVAELVNNSLWQKQVTGEARLAGFVKYAIGVGIQFKHIPPPPAGKPEEAYKWTFGYPAEMTVDQGNDEAAALNRLRYGLTSQRMEAARKGYILKRIRADRQKEAMNLVDDAAALLAYAKTKHKQELPFLKAIEFFWQPSPNSASLPAAAKPEDKAEEEKAGAGDSGADSAGSGRKPPANE